MSLGNIATVGQESRDQMSVRHATSWRRAVALTVSLLAWLAGGTNNAVAQPTPTDRIVVRLDVGSRPASRTFGTHRRFTVFAEQGSFETNYGVDQGSVVDGGISYLLWRNLAVGLDVSSYRSINTAQITSQLPHPFFFDLPRTTTGVSGGLARHELGVHIQSLWVSQLTDWLVMSLSGGPSLISARQDLVSSVEHAEIGFPFEAPIFVNHTVNAESGITVGWNTGVSIDTFFLHRLPGLSRYGVLENAGLGLLFRYLRGSLNLQTNDDPVHVDLGGLQITAGLRLRF